MPKPTPGESYNAGVNAAFKAVRATIEQMQAEPLTKSKAPVATGMRTALKTLSERLNLVEKVIAITTVSEVES